MATYFIDIRDADGVVRDAEGASYSGLEEALSEAKASARDLIRQYMERQLPLGAACVEVRDIQGTIMASLTVAEILEHPSHPFFKNDCSDSPDPGHR
jgi:hypothetical protein